MRNTKNFMSWGKRITAAFIACACVLFSACGNIINTAQNEKSSAIPAESALVSTDEKQQGGDLFIAMPVGVKSLDPLTATDEDLVNLLALIYEPAVRVGNDGKPEPCLAESWTVDESGTVYTFKVRPNVTFTDGTPLTAADIVYSANRVVSVTGAAFGVPIVPSVQPSEPSPSASPEASPTVEIVQSNPYSRYNSIVAGIEAVDTETVKLTMTKPGVEALYFMSFPIMTEALAAQGMTVGTGPYKLEAFDAETEAVFAVNDTWWGTKPNIQQIVAKPMTGSSAKLDAVSTSVLDFVTTDVLYAGKYKIAGKTQVVDYMTNYYDCLIPNLSNAALGVTEVRKALSYTIDRREIISTVLLNHAVPANMPIAPNFYAYDPKYKQDDNLKTARELLRSAGYKTSADDPDGGALQFSLIVPDDRTLPYRMEAARAIAKQCEEVGITINVETLNQKDYYDRLQAKSFDLALCSFYMDEDPDIGFMFDIGGAANYGGVNSSEITGAISAARNAFKEEDIVNAYSELQKQLTERVPQIGLYYRMNSVVCNDLLKDLNGMRQGRVFAHVNEWYYKKS
ncbi:MAG: ABC transporter substrate-binding protein [Christensenella sp.]